MPLVPLGQAAPVERRERYRRPVTPGRAVAGVLAALGLGVLFGFPAGALFLLPFAGLGVVVAARWPWGGAAAGTLFASGFLAQLTSIFVTPFTWPLRFAFFCALIGGFVALAAWQTRQLD